MALKFFIATWGNVISFSISISTKGNLDLRIFLKYQAPPSKNKNQENQQKIHHFLLPASKISFNFWILYKKRLFIEKKYFVNKIWKEIKIMYIKMNGVFFIEI